jgi:methionyl-tRNA synthetase
MPESAAGILDQLAVEKGQRTFAFLETEHALKPGTPLIKPVGLFPRFSHEEDTDAG